MGILLILATTLSKSIRLMARITTMHCLKLDLSHAYLHWDQSRSTVHGYMCQMMIRKEKIYIQEYGIDKIKDSGIIGSKKFVHIWFSSEGDIGIQFWFWRTVLEFVMLY
jgi:hypothetical protein